MDRWELSQRFLQPLTSARVHLLPPWPHEFSLCLGHADHLRVKGGITFQSHSHTATTTSTCSYFPANTPDCLCQHTNTCIFSQRCAFIFLPTSPTLFRENEKTHKMKSRIRAWGWSLNGGDRWGLTNISSRESPHPRLEPSQSSVWKTDIFVSKKQNITGGKGTESRGRGCILRQKESPALNGREPSFSLAIIS